MRLKNWEKPRDKKRRRNTKGKNASARLRQLKKRDQVLRKKLKDEAFSSFFIQNFDPVTDILAKNPHLLVAVLS